jgi:hypothetical protein
VQISLSDPKQNDCGALGIGELSLIGCATVVAKRDISGHRRVGAEIADSR